MDRILRVVSLPAKGIYVAGTSIERRALSVHTCGYKIGCTTHAVILCRYRNVAHKRPVKPNERVRR